MMLDFGEITYTKMQDDQLEPDYKISMNAMDSNNLNYQKIIDTRKHLFEQTKTIRQNLLKA